MANVCVYCSSSPQIDDGFTPVAQTLGTGLARRDHTLIYGGGTSGLMGVVARAVREGGGSVVGVIPNKLKSIEGVARDTADELIVTDTMSERKRIMYLRSDAFVVLPGGFGTLEEFLEVLTLRQLAYHERPVVIVNHDGFYDPLLGFFEQLYAQHFSRTPHEELIFVADTPGEALHRLDTMLQIPTPAPQE
ncbi:MAG: TIGR00730 family Rossman fold protein [Longimonas sp.]|uniref:LOG family protein n=1 Tax=Longimonas sp. TaxID=2039626 RepID=UPI003974C345